MILLLDTSTPVCKVTVVSGNERLVREWEAGRGLAKGLLAYLEAVLAEADGDFQALQGIGVMKGPGSFTGLRIGLTVANTLADSLKIPIVGETGESWQERALERLKAGQSDQIVLPLYGAEAHITQPRK